MTRRQMMMLKRLKCVIQKEVNDLKAGTVSGLGVGARIKMDNSGYSGL